MSSDASPLLSPQFVELCVRHREALSGYPMADLMALARGPDTAAAGRSAAMAQFAARLVDSWRRQLADRAAEYAQVDTDRVLALRAELQATRQALDALAQALPAVEPAAPPGGAEATARDGEVGPVM